MTNTFNIMSKELPLTKGYVAIVDDEDYEWLNQWSWCANESGYNVYGRRKSKGKGYDLHREILGVTDGCIDVDHINHDTLDNRKCNLRKSTRSQNQANKRPMKGCKSRFKGVYPRKDNFRVKIRVNGEIIHIGMFTTEEEAALAYNRAAKKHFGEFAYLNKVKETQLKIF